MLDTFDDIIIFLKDSSPDILQKQDLEEMVNSLTAFSTDQREDFRIKLINQGFLKETNDIEDKMKSLDERLEKANKMIETQIELQKKVFDKGFKSKKESELHYLGLERDVLNKRKKQNEEGLIKGTKGLISEIERSGLKPGSRAPSPIPVFTSAEMDRLQAEIEKLKKEENDLKFKRAINARNIFVADEDEEEEEKDRKKEKLKEEDEKLKELAVSIKNLETEFEIEKNKLGSETKEEMEKRIKDEEERKARIAAAATATPTSGDTSKEAAVHRYEARHFERIVDLENRLKHIEDELAGLPVVMDPVDVEYKRLLEGGITNLRSSMSAAIDRVHNMSFEENIEVRLQVLESELDTSALLRNIGDEVERVYYAQIITGQKVELERSMQVARGLLDSQGFAGIANIRTRYDTLANELLAADSFGDPDVKEYYKQLLTPMMNALVASMWAAQHRFDGHGFAGIPNIQMRFNAIEVELDSMSLTSITDLNERAYYEQLLIPEREALEYSMQAAQGRFDGRGFAGIANIEMRCQALDLELGGLASIVDLNERAHYEQLLRPMRLALEHSIQAARDRLNGHGFGGMAVDVRYPALKHELGELGNIADQNERIYYEQLLRPMREAVLHSMEEARNRFDGHGFAGISDLTARISALDRELGALSGIVDPDEKQHYEQSLRKERADADAERARIEAARLAGEAAARAAAAILPPPPPPPPVSNADKAQQQKRARRALVFLFV